MDKVTEQDLIDRGFDKKAYYYGRIFNHYFFDQIEITINFRLSNIRMYRLELENDACHELNNKPLTLANLDLFIRFAEVK